MKISIEKDLERLFGPLFKRGINRKARRRKGKKATNHITIRKAEPMYSKTHFTRGLIQAKVRYNGTDQPERNQPS